MGIIEEYALKRTCTVPDRGTWQLDTGARTINLGALSALDATDAVAGTMAAWITPRRVLRVDWFTPWHAVVVAVVAS